MWTSLTLLRVFGTFQVQIDNYKEIKPCHHFLVSLLVQQPSISRAACGRDDLCEGQRSTPSDWSLCQFHECDFSGISPVHICSFGGQDGCSSPL